MIQFDSDGFLKLEYGKTCDIDRALPQTPFLPPFVRWHDRTQDLWVFEFPPTRHNIILGNAYYMKTTDPFARVGEFASFPVPWTVWFVSVHAEEARVFCRTEQMHTLSDQLYHCHIPHVRTDHTTCYYGPYASMGESLLTQALGLVHGFWNTWFSAAFYPLAIKGDENLLPTEMLAYIEDLPPGLGIEEISVGGYRSVYISQKIFDWFEELTIEDLLHWQWKPAEKAIEDYIKEHSNDFYHHLEVTGRRRSAGGTYLWVP